MAEGFILTEGCRKTLTPTAETVPPEDSSTAAVVRKFRNRLSDIDDAMLARLIDRMRDGESVRSLVQAILDAGYCSHLAPKSIEVYLGKIRAALGIPVSNHDEESGEPEDQPIEAGDALEILRWCIRVQIARVKKGLRLERMMNGMLLPQATTELKLLADFLAKELRVVLETGDLKATPPGRVVAQQPTEGLLPTDPAVAMRVLTTIRRVLDVARREAEEEIAFGRGDPGDPTAPAEPRGVPGATVEPAVIQVGPAGSARSNGDCAGDNAGGNGRGLHESPGA